MNELLNFLLDPLVIIQVVGGVIALIAAILAIFFKNTVNERTRKLTKWGWASLMFLLVAASISSLSKYYELAQQKEKELEDRKYRDSVALIQDSIREFQIQQLETLTTKLTSFQTISLSNDSGMQNSLAFSLSRLEKLNQIEKRQQDENAFAGNLDFDFGSQLKDDDKITVKFGTNLLTTTVAQVKNSKRPISFVLAYGRELFTFNIVNNKLTLNLTSFNLNGGFIASIENNIWRRNPNSSAMFNYDKKGFEIIDNYGNIAINVDLISKDTIFVKGYIPMPEQKSINICGDGGCLMIPVQNEQGITNAIRRYTGQRMFEYNTPNWLHKRRVIK